MPSPAIASPGLRNDSSTPIARSTMEREVADLKDGESASEAAVSTLEVERYRARGGKNMHVRDEVEQSAPAPATTGNAENEQLSKKMQLRNYRT